MKKTIPFIIGLAVIFSLGITVTPAAAQINTLPFRQYMGTYTPIVGGLTVGSPTSLDDGYWTMPLPFPFVFDGTTYTTCYPGTNGYLCFGAPYTTLGNILSYNWGGEAIAAYSSDLYFRSATDLTYEVTGVAPNRCLTIQCANVYHFGNASEYYNWQYKLYETSGKIDIVYGSWTGISTYTGGVGLKGLSTNAYDINARSVTQGINTWDTSVPGTYTSTCTISPPTFYPTPGQTYSWGCNVPAGSASFDLSDIDGSPLLYVYSPGSIRVNYTISYPPATAYNVPITVNFYRIGGSQVIPEYTTAFVVYKPVGTLTGSQIIPVNIQTGYYRVEVVFSLLNNCLLPEDVTMDASVLSMPPGATACEVLPGDVNRDNVVNYADRRDLNMYIHDANLNPLWLNGPARYLAEGANNPLVYLEFVPQISVPWYTADGCYMDTDGNGVVNSLDYLAMKLNWLREWTGYPTKSHTQFRPSTFDVDQNYPNPFNPTTSLRYSAPERSRVRIVVVDMLGRTVATLVDGIVDAGTHTAVFDASQLQSGTYVAMVSMTGLDSGFDFSRNVKMVLNK